MRRLSRVLLVSLWLAFVPPAASAGDAGTPMPFAIPAQPLRGALEDFARQSGLQVSADAALTADRRARAVAGRFTPARALELLLAGTGLSWRVTASGAMVLQSAPQPGNAMVLDPVRVEASDGSFRTYETPGSVDTVSREQLERVPATSARDVFAGVPGVWVQNARQDPAMNINIRGVQGPGRVSVTLDGARQNAAQYNGYNGLMSRVYVDPELLASIDIRKGPTSGAGGSGQIGGRVSMRTLGVDDILPDDETIGARLRGTFGDNGANRLTSAAVATRFGERRRFDVVAAVSRRDYGDYHAGDSEPNLYLSYYSALNGEIVWEDFSVVDRAAVVPNTSQAVTSGLLKATARFGDGHRIEAGVTHYDSDFGNAVIGLAPTDEDSSSQARTQTYGIKYNWLPESHPWLDLQARLWHVDTRVHQTANETLSLLDTWGGEVTNSTPWSAVGFEALSTLGAEYHADDAAASRTDDATEANALNVAGKRSLGSVFLRNRWRRDWLELGADVRYDHYTINGDGSYQSFLPEQADTPFLLDKGEGRLSPGFTAVVSPLPGWQWYATYVEGFRPPSLGEVLLSGEIFIVFVPNLELRPEVARNREVGMNYLHDGPFGGDGRLGVKLAGFDNRIDDYIDRQRFIYPDRMAVRFVNLERARFRGWEANLSLDVGWLFADAGYMRFSRVEFCDAGVCESTRYGSAADNNGAPYVPPENKWHATLATRWLDRRLTVGVRTRHDGERSLEAAENGAPDSSWNAYTVWDAFAEFRFGGRVEIGMSAENLEDEYYVDALSTDVIPAPGRTVKVTLTVNLR